MLSLLIFIGVLAVTLWAPNLGVAAQRSISFFTRQRFLRGPLAIYVVAGAAFLLCLCTALLLFWPIPSVHDEFAYVLTADTFALGRVTNPAHPFANHFASWHILVSPTYQAKYPPAQGAALWLGQLLTGEKLIGVWITFALAAAASYWAYTAWLPRRWAILAAVLTLSNVPMSFAWGNSYWGGAVAMLGGSLVVGAIGFMRRRSAWFDSAALGVGLVLLAAARPFEGALMSLPLGVCGLIWVSRKICRKQIPGWYWFRLITPATVALCVGLCGLLFYNYEVTGSWTTMPYQVWTAQQGESLSRSLTPAIVLVNTPEVAIDLQQDSSWRAAELAHWMQVRSSERLAFTVDKIQRTYQFYLQAVLWIPLLALPIVLRRQPHFWGLVAAIVLVTLGTCSHLSAGHPHYVAGLTSAIMILAIAGLRQLLHGLPTYGRMLTGAIVLGWMVTGGLLVGEEAYEARHARAHAWAWRRQALLETLQQASLHENRKQLVFVRYAAEHNVHQEWVYNPADIDSASVVFANDLGVEANRALVDYYLQQQCEVAPKLLSVGRDREKLEDYPLDLEDYPLDTVKFY